MSEGLTHSELKRRLSYDPETGIFRWKIAKRVNIKPGDIAGTDRGGYVQIVMFRKRYHAHRLAFHWMTGTPLSAKEEVDHINGIKGDNRWENLRVVSRGENCKNKAIPRSNSSGAMGVGWDTVKGKWVAHIKVNKRHIHLGYFTDFNQAKSKRESAEKQYGFHPNHGRPA
jgi:hypothetical protein